MSRTSWTRPRHRREIARTINAPRDVPTRGRRNADHVASSRSPEATTNDEDEDDADYNEEAYGTDDDADSGEEPDKGMSDSDAESDDDDALEESQPATPPVRRGHGKAAPGDKSATVGGEPPRRAPKTQEPMPVKRSVWSPTEKTILVAARWFMKDELEPLLGKQGSQYWARLRPRVAETATMAAAKLVSDTIKDCHADAMVKLEGLVRAWMQQDAEIARARNQLPAPPPPTVNRAPADAATQPAAAAAEGDDGVWFRRGDHGGGEATPDEAEEMWVRGDAV
ncbi:unnamed protein product [Closterium sp. NIES-65]|nr:unnamed protein product [Closterium sp. NIES-65]CAI5995333.1 unnamed protein product [Closterium sp. NIES-65]